MKNITNQQNTWGINQVFIFFSTMLVSAFLLKEAAPLITPVLIALALAIILTPALNYLQSKGLNKVVSLFLILFVVSLPLLYISNYMANELREFASNYHNIKEQLYQRIRLVIEFLSHYGITLQAENIKEFLQDSDISGMFKKLLSQANTQLSNTFIIILMLFFMVLESQYFHKKMLKIAQESNLESTTFTNIIENIQGYFRLKVLTSFITAVLVFGVLWFFHIHYYALLAFLAFLLNFIPVIGSIFAAVPAVILAFLEYGVESMAWVGLWYLLINIIIGNIVEPRIMGKGFGFSPVAIFLSMNFWGWMFGPTGMILSVPLTMVLYFLFSQYQETKWIALLLSDYKGESNS